MHTHALSVNHRWLADLPSWFASLEQKLRFGILGLLACSLSLCGASLWLCTGSPPAPAKLGQTLRRLLVCGWLATTLPPLLLSLLPPLSPCADDDAASAVSVTADAGGLAGLSELLSCEERLVMEACLAGGYQGT